MVDFYKKILLALLFCISQAVLAQTAPIIVQAESGTRSPDTALDIRTEAGVTYITPTLNFAEPADAPRTASRVITYSVTFPAAGTYDLYIRHRVGPDQGGAADDSFYYGRGFGVKSATTPSDWVRVNNNQAAGYAAPADVVLAAGNVPVQTWKWLNISTFAGQEPGVTFTVPADALTQTFQWGSREDGLDVDMFAFGITGQAYTVATFDNSAGNTAPAPIAAGKSKFLGNIYSGSQLTNFTHYWNQVAPENAGKWGSVEATRDVMNWANLDAAYKLAKDNNFPFRMHVLVWGNQQPSWIENLSAAEQLAEIREWFAAVAERYPDIDHLEVVNEPINDPPRKMNATDQGSGNYIGALGGNGTSGWDWVLTSFRLAREYFPKAKLMLNEYSLTSSTSRTQQYVALINLLKAESLIDIVGIQGHYFSTRNIPAATILSNLNLIAATNLPVYITEFDIDDRGLNQTPVNQAQADQYQLQEYQRIFPIFWEHRAVQGVTLWGFRPGMWRTEQGAMLVRADGSERPAMTWLREYVAATVTSSPERKQLTFALYPNPVANGKFTVEGTEKVKLIRVLDIQGKQVKELKVENQSVVTVDLQTAPGIYIIQLSDGQRTFTKKLLVQ